MEALAITREGNIAIVKLDHGKVNALDLTMASDLLEVFPMLDADESVSGVILTGKENGFCAGLDVVSLVKGGSAYQIEFWRTFLQAMQAMIRFSKPLVGAISGYAPAAGTSLVCCCDYRIMARGAKHVIGMHEFKLSLPVPEMMCLVFAYAMGDRQAWEAVQKSRLYDADEATAIGLINEACESDEVMPKAMEYMNMLLGTHVPVIQKTKQFFRTELQALLDLDVEHMVAQIAQDWQDPHLVKTMGMFAARLKG